MKSDIRLVRNGRNGDAHHRKDGAANDQTQYQKLMNELVGALELCLESDGLTWEAEQEAELVCARAREVLG